MYPGGHARNTTADLKTILTHKWTRLAELAVENADPAAATALTRRFANLARKSAADIADVNTFALCIHGTFE
jgi:2-methylcitrate dehydratase